MADPMDDLRQASADVSSVEVLSPAAHAVWEAFNREEPGVFVDYGDCLAAALRAVAEQCQIEWNYHPDYPETEWVVVASDLTAIADELGGRVNSPKKKN